VVEEGHMIREFRRAPWWAWAILTVVGLFVILAIAGSFADDDGDAEPKDVIGRDASATIGDQMSSTAVASPEPSTPTPTSIPPTAVPEPISLNGVGQQVTAQFLSPSGISKASFTHDGSSNFIVKAYDENGEELLLINEIGSYVGSRPLIGSGSWFLEVDADGRWSATVEAISLDPNGSQSFTGSGDAVSALFEPTSSGATPFEVSNVGESNFVVWLHCGGGSELVQNEIGSVQGSTVVDFEDGPCFWEVQSDGAWSVRKR